jgi:hypothetical protein
VNSPQKRAIQKYRNSGGPFADYAKSEFNQFLHFDLDPAGPTS